MTWALVVLYLLVLPYLGLMIMVIVGTRRPDRAGRRSDRPSVTVVLPAHNEETRLGPTLLSLSRQEYDGPLEFVIVDDRSTDATPHIIDAVAGRDPRFRRLTLTKQGRRYSPKVNAVNAGISSSTGEIIITTDADGEYPAGWIAELVAHFAPGVVMVVGYVECTRAWRTRGWLQLFESADWLSLMLSSRSMTRFGFKAASSACNQAYLRSAFEAVRGFGPSGRAPSGDEDLLTQRLGKLPDARIVFAGTPASRVLTQPVESVSQLLKQRRRWISRYHHLMHYEPRFLASIALLGLQSIALALAILLLPFFPAAAPWVLGLVAAKLLIEMTGMSIGCRQFSRHDLAGLPSLFWAMLHPFFIGWTVVLSFTRPADWKGGNVGYRTRWYRRQLQLAGRRVRNALLRPRRNPFPGGAGRRRPRVA